MPGNIAAPVPVGILPQSLCTAFNESRQFPMLTTPQYHDGRIGRTLITDTVNPVQSIRNWKLAKRLTSDQVSTLRDFFEAHNGGQIPFYYYDPFEPADGQATGSNYANSGTCDVSGTTVSFDSGESFGDAMVGREISVNGTSAMVTTYTPGTPDTLTLDADVGTASAVPFVVFGLGGQFQGMHVCFFTTQTWTQTTDISRSSTSLEMVESGLYVST